MSIQDGIVATIIAAAIGFLIGRTRESGDEQGKPGIRDFVVLALLGSVAGILGSTVVFCVLGVLSITVLAVVRYQHPERSGVTSDLSALLTYALGYLCLNHTQLAAAIGILLTLVLTSKKELHGFALRTISQREFDDTVKFLALIFLIYPLLPEGRYGPFEFIEPRKIWFFVILVSGVSFAGYFLTRFLDPGKGVVLAAVVGGLASTTAYTAGASKAVEEDPERAIPMSHVTVLANTILFPRMYVILVAIDPTLAAAAVPVFGAMLVAGLLLAVHKPLVPQNGAHRQGFENPFTFLPALRFGLIFSAVLFVTRAGVHLFGSSGRLIAASLGGLLDVDAVLLSTAEGHRGMHVDTAQAILAMYFAVAANAVFKTGLAVSSRSPAFYVRVGIGFFIMLAAGAVAFMCAEGGGVSGFLR